VAGTVVVRAAGKSAHGSQPEDGHSAILDLADFLAAGKPGASAPAHMLRFLSECVGFDLCGERLGIFACHDLVGWTTVNIGTVATMPDGSCEAVANVRIPVGVTVVEIADGVARRAREYADGTGICVEAAQLARGHEPLYVDPDSELVKGLSRAYEATMGEKAELRATGGTTFAKSMPNCVAFGAAMDGDPATYHQVDERTSIDVLVRNARIFAAAIVELCGE